MSSSADINILLGGSSFELYQLYAKDAAIAIPSSKIIIENGKGRVILHYQGWRSNREKTPNPPSPQAIVILYEASSANDENFERWIDEVDCSASLMYTIGYNEEDSESYACSSNPTRVHRQLLDFTININERSAARALRLIVEDIQRHMPHEGAVSETIPLIEKKDSGKCIIM
jgi:hypothetical protein